MAYKDPIEYRNYQSNYRREHREQAREYSKAYHAQHPEQWREYTRKYDATHRTERSAYHQRYYARNREKYRALNRANYARKIKELRVTAFEAHGHKCSCCGETNEIFLTLHHINGDGHEDRSQRDYIAIWRRAVAQPEAYRILCWNCHMAIHHNGGHCPHEHVREVMT